MYRSIQKMNTQKDISRSGVYGGLKCSFDHIIFGTFFKIPFDLSQHKMTKSLVTGPRKKWAAPSSVTIIFQWREYLGLKNTLKCSFSEILLWFWCLNIGIVNEVSKLNFEGCMKIGHCVFSKMDILGQHLAQGHFSRLIASLLQFIILTNAAVKRITNLTYSRNLSILSAKVCPQRSF